MRIALHWNPLMLGDCYGHRAQGVLFSALLALPDWQESTNVYVGDLLIGRHAQQVASLWGVADSQAAAYLTDRWLSSDFGQLADLRMKRLRESVTAGVYLTLLDTLLPGRALALHNALVKCEAYLGMSEPRSEDVVQQFFCSTLLAYGRIAVRKFRLFPDLIDLGSDQLSELDLVKEHNVFDSVSFEDIANVPGVSDLVILQLEAEGLLPMIECKNMDRVFRRKDSASSRRTDRRP